MNTKPIRTIRLTDTKITGILDALDAEADAQPGAKALRGTVRYSYRADMIVVCMRQPGSTDLTAFHVATRDISATGISFLHGGFVHRTSKCVVMLVTRECDWHEVSGRVIECRYITHNVHEVRVEFDKEIDTVLFCEAADQKTPCESAPESRIRPSSICLQADHPPHRAENSSCRTQPLQ